MTTSSPSSLSRLYAHLEWANAQVLNGLRREPGNDPAALELFAHLIGTEHVWLSRILGRESRIAVWPTLTLDQCEALGRENLLELAALLKNGDDLDRPVDYVNSRGDSFTSSVREILLHVALHGAYHRGQISTLVRQGGGQPQPTDFIAFSRGAAAATRDDG